MIQLASRVLYEDRRQGVSLLADFGTANELYENVLRIRNSEPSGSGAYEFDTYSTHYCLLHQRRPIGAMSITRSLNGRIDCQDFFPPALLDHFGQSLASACKFRLLRNPNSSFAALRLMIREIWRDQMSEGVRLDVINAEQSLVPFYQRIGYSVIEDSGFVHPLLDTDSTLLVLPADPTRVSFCQDLFQKLVDPLELQFVHAKLNSNRFELSV